MRDDVDSYNGPLNIADAVRDYNEWLLVQQNLSDASENSLENLQQLLPKIQSLFADYKDESDPLLTDPILEFCEENPKLACYKNEHGCLSERLAECLG